MEHVLLLNITYEPLKVINWKRAITLLCLGKVEVIEEYSREIHSVSITFKLPSVVRLLKMVKRPKSAVRFSRQNIYARDRYRCQYCGGRHLTEDLTYDHIIPKARGGKTEWENIVTCCIDCNRKKGGRTPSEASMKLIRKPIRPTWVPGIRITIRFQDVPKSWRDYLYWNVELLDLFPSRPPKSTWTNLDKETIAPKKTPGAGFIPAQALRLEPIDPSRLLILFQVIYG